MTALADSRRFGKFFRMLRMGLPEGAVRQLMHSQGVDQRVLALGADASERDADALATTSEELRYGPAVDTRVYEKSLRMLLAGVPQAAVEQAVRVRTLDTRAYEQTLGRLHATLAQRLLTVLPAVVDDDNEKAMATNLARAGVPNGAIQQRLSALRTAEVEAQTSPWTKFFAMAATKPDDGQASAGGVPDAPTMLQDYGALRRFFAMLRAGVAVEAVEQALSVAGLPRELAHWEPTLPVQSFAGAPL